MRPERAAAPPALCRCYCCCRLVCLLALLCARRECPAPTTAPAAAFPAMPPIMAPPAAPLALLPVPSWLFCCWFCCGCWGCACCWAGVVAGGTVVDCVCADVCGTSAVVRDSARTNDINLDDFTCLSSRLLCSGPQVGPTKPLLTTMIL